MTKSNFDKIVSAMDDDFIFASGILNDTMKKYMEVRDKLGLSKNDKNKKQISLSIRVPDGEVPSLVIDDTSLLFSLSMMEATIENVIDMFNSKPFKELIGKQFKEKSDELIKKLGVVKVGDLKVKCPNCKMENEPDGRFCKDCGTKLPP